MSQQNTTNSNRPPLPSGFRLKEPGEVEYVIEKTLSTTGGFGITYLATELFMKRTRAVVLKENYPTDTAWRNPESGTLTPYNETEKFFRSTYDKFLREAQIIRHLEHPNIVRVYSAFEALGTAYYTMPYLEGAKELWQAAPTPDKIDEAWLLPILQKLLGALNYLHDFELLHRDLKTNNIMLLPNGTPVIIDFGIARSISAGVSTTLQIGTPGFSPIEQGAHTAAAASDLYSLGATCYALITGKIPPIAQNRLLGTDPYEPLCNMAELNGRFNHELLSSIDRALQIMPNDRWQSAQEWLNELNGTSSTTAPLTVPPTPQQPPTKQQEARQRLLEQNITPDDYDEELIKAAEKGKTELVKLLIAAGADVNKADKDGDTPLYWAESNGQTECVKLLIDAGADVNKANKDGETPLRWAAWNGRTECMKLLIAAGADVNKANKYGRTPLYLAACNGRTECMKLLIDAGADVNLANYTGQTPLLIAAWNGRTECVKLLISAGADVNKADEDGYTPLYKAEEGGHTECAELLRAAGNTHVPTIEEPAPTPKITQQAAQAELRQKGISAAEYDSKLIEAAKNGKTELVKLLIAAGADVNKATGEYGWTPLYEAAWNGHTECVKLLIAAGADVNKADKDGETPLYRAASNGHTECVKLLIAAGADVNKADKEGQTPLSRAALLGETECVKLLIAAGADVNRANNEGKTPLYWAERFGHTECAELLRNCSGIKGFFIRFFS